MLGSDVCQQTNSVDSIPSSHCSVFSSESTFIEKLLSVTVAPAHYCTLHVMPNLNISGHGWKLNKAEDILDCKNAGLN